VRIETGNLRFIETGNLRFIETGNFQTRILLSLCGLLTLVIVAEWLLPYRADPADELNAESADLELPTMSSSSYVHPHIDDFGAILERPVFFKNRKLPPKVAAEPAAAPAPIRLKLEGVAIVAEARIAVLRNLADNQLVQLAEGMSHNGWTLDAVNANSATFKRGGQVSELSLELATGRRR
jgi:hypothetical protein